MTDKTIKAAIEEAKEFVRRASIVLKDEHTMRFIGIGCGNKATGSLRRQSLELTRALSRMRGYV